MKADARIVQNGNVVGDSINVIDNGLFVRQSFLSSADQTNAISGRIKKGKETIATIDGYWDGRIDVKDKKTGVSASPARPSLSTLLTPLSR